MPKIIENPQARLIAEAKRQLQESGYASMTIRSIARACGVGIGTVYNYFPSKEALLATFMLSDWKTCTAAIADAAAAADSPEPVVRCIYDQLRGYAARHQAVFRDEAAASAFAGSFSRYHALLRSQLAAPLGRFCRDDFTAEFIAEALLTWTMAEKDFDEIHTLVSKLF